jgi:hypothetical protein
MSNTQSISAQGNNVGTSTQSSVRTINPTNPQEQHLSSFGTHLLQRTFLEHRFLDVANVRYYLLIWPICHIYGVYYIYYKYNIRYYGYDNFY